MYVIYMYVYVCTSSSSTWVRTGSRDIPSKRMELIAGLEIVDPTYIHTYIHI